MSQRSKGLEELLQQCTVKLTSGQSGYGYGTGFFVAPGLILTCAHVVKAAGDQPVIVRWQNQENFAEARVEKSLSDFDLALLRFSLLPDDTPSCVYLDEAVKSRDPLYLFGYPDRDFPNGRPVTFACEGFTGDDPPFIMFQLGQVRPGMSGSPLLNQRTGKVCGIVKFTCDSGSNLGGGAIPTSVILEKFPELLELQRRFHEEEPHWIGLLSSSVKLHGVPELPPHFLPRPNELQALKKKVLRDTNQPVAVTGRAVRVGLQGMGGIGKSVLAAALARDDEVNAAFPDGIFWLAIGQEPKITLLQSTLTKALSHISEVFVDEQDGRTRLSELLENKACLLILDDVWQTNCLEAFDVLGQHCRMLLTTRDRGIITASGAEEYSLDVLSDEDALKLLADWIGQNPEDLPVEALEVVRECGNLSLALALSGAQVRDGTTWEELRDALREADLEFLDHPHGSVLKSLKVSINALQKENELHAQCYQDLAVFPQQTSVPEAAILTLWEYTKGLNERKARQLITILARKALLRITGESPRRWIELHDLQHDYLCLMAGETLAELHDSLLEAYRQNVPMAGIQVRMMAISSSIWSIT